MHQQGMSDANGPENAIQGNRVGKYNENQENLELEYHHQRETPCSDYFLNMIIGVIYLLCFIPVKDEPNRWKYSFYYSLNLIENAVFTLLWFYGLTSTSSSASMLSSKVTQELPWFATQALLLVFGSFFLGLVLLLLYYRFLHPSGKPLLINRAAKCC